MSQEEDYSKEEREEEEREGRWSCQGLLEERPTEWERGLQTGDPLHQLCQSEEGELKRPNVKCIGGEREERHS